jgi:class 3 adenylate cyclase
MNEPETPASAPPPATVRRHVPLTLVLVGGITLLILLSVGSVLYISLREATENTLSLLADKADVSLDLLEAQLQTRLSPTEAAGTELALHIADGDYSIDDPDRRLHHMLRGALAALPRATAVIFATADGQAIRTARIDGEIAEVPENAFLRERQKLGIARAASLETPSWVEPVWMPVFGEPVLSFIAPVRRGERLVGAVVIATRLDELTNFLQSIETKTGVRAFILYDGRFVLGHPELTRQRVGLPDAPNGGALPSIEAFEEAAFRLLRADARRAETLLARSRIDDAPIDDEYLLLIREVRSYGAVPWQIALRFRQADVSVELNRLWAAGAAGLSILLLAVAIGYLFTRNLNRQIGRLAMTATRLRDLDVADLAPLPDSRLRELSNAANAFNSLIAAMRWFETYVPKTLVLRLMRAGDGAMQSDERELTIMFTDIRGFSTLVEHMSPGETADFLNRHFALLAACIEAEGGTVDKFIGDAVMAFWGAPEPQDDHAMRALRAARAIQQAIEAENTRCRAAGLPTVAVRIGIHSGPVVVGNIGSKHRLNYTVIGDTVNVAARLESFAKELAIDDDCVTLISGATRQAAGAALSGDIATEHLGEVPVRGREGRVEVYRLRI